MNKASKATIFLIGLIFFGAGCLEQASKPATVINRTEPIVPAEIAAQALDEPVPKTTMAMPCLRFKNRDGFLSWADNYQQGLEPMAKDMAVNIGLAESADPNLTGYLTSSVPQDSEFIGLCVIHKQLELVTWGVESAQTTDIYAYHQERLTNIKLELSADNQTAHCLPSIITDSEMIWKCGPISDIWKQVHVNRKSGEMKAIECNQKNPSPGCLR